MSDDASMIDDARPTRVRHAVLLAMTLMSVLLYLDRFAVGIAQNYIREDLGMTQSQMSWFISAFFWSYALCQVPAGWLSDRFGGRAMLTVYIFTWSILMGMMGIAHAVWGLLWLRLFCGAFQAGAYPTSVSLIRQWYPISGRGTASSIVGLGGRFGAVLAPLLTAPLIIWFAPGDKGAVIQESDVLDREAFLSRFEKAPDPKTPRDQFVSAFVASLSESEQQLIQSGSVTAASELKARVPKPWRLIDLKDWLPFLYAEDSSPDRRSIEGSTELLNSIKSRMSDPSFIDFKTVSVPLSTEMQGLLERRQRGDKLTVADTVQLNRSAMEILFPKEIRKFHGPGWRPTFIVYGVAGLIVAFGFAVVTRNKPNQHPWCNQSECDLIDDEATRESKSREPSNPPFPWRAFLTSLSLWGNSMTQFLTNIGWLFVVTLLPRYLDDVHNVPLVTKGIMTAFPSGIGILGLFAGGRATDWAFKKFGLKMGRRIPIASSRFTAAAGYALCLGLSALFVPSLDNWWLPWLYIVGLCIASASTDFGSPAIWSYAQDVGGPYTASILGWGNMWGNLGAAVAPLLYDRALGENPTLQDWNTVFAMCCGVFVVAGFCALVVDSTKQLTVEGPAS
jgi:ACS family glucarate transporter-like MFS transporter